MLAQFTHEMRAAIAVNEHRWAKEFPNGIKACKSLVERVHRVVLGGMFRVVAEKVEVTIDDLLNIDHQGQFLAGIDPATRVNFQQHATNMQLFQLVVS